MIITVKVKPGAKTTQLVEQNEGVMTIKLKAIPEKGKANQELIRFLASHFDVAKSQITITKGLTSKTKTVTIL